MIAPATSAHFLRITTGAWVALVALLHFSCDRKSGTHAAAGSTGNEVKAMDPPAAPAMSTAEFVQRLRDAISGSRTQSEVTARVEKLCANLEKQHLDTLFGETSKGPPAGISSPVWHLGLNQVMEYARTHPGFDAAAPLFRLAANPAAQAVARDYACQHYLLAESATLDELHAAGDLDGWRKHLAEVLDNAASLVSSATTESGTLPGTSLMGLAAIATGFDKYPRELTVIREKVATLVMPVLEAPANHSVSTRVSAIQAAARLQIEKAGPIIAGIALDPKAGIRDRLSAIASLRYFPSLVSISQLETLAGRDKKLALATRSLIEELKRN